MKLHKCLVVAKELQTRLDLERAIRDVPLNISVSFESDFEKIIKILYSFEPWIIVIDMTDTSDEEFKLLSDLNYFGIPIILISSNPQHAVEAYSIDNVIDFIPKPVINTRLKNAILKTIKFQKFNNSQFLDVIYLKTGRTFTKFVCEDIIHVEAYGTYSKVVTSKGKFVINSSISKLEEGLTPYNFVRIHKSYIINISKIESISNNYFELINDVKIPIGATHKKRVEGLIFSLTKAVNESSFVE